MECVLQFKRLCQLDMRRLFPMMGIVAISLIVLQTLIIPYRFGLPYLIPDSKIFIHDQSSLHIGYWSHKSVAGDVHFVDESKSIDSSVAREIVRELKNEVTLENHPRRDYLSQLNQDFRVEGGFVDEMVSGLDKDILKDVISVPVNNLVVEGGRDPEGGSSTMDEVTVENGEGRDRDNLSQLDKDSGEEDESLFETVSSLNKSISGIVSVLGRGRESEGEFLRGDEKAALSSNKKNPILLPDGSALSNRSMITGNTTVRRKRCDMPPKTVMTFSEMNSLLIRRRASSGILKPRWLTVRDKEVLSARSQIEKASSTKDNKDLFGPLFRNVSMFEKSYELMDRTLKVYVYREGEKPIFHQPILKGLYASEGWFMKLMEGNKKYLVKDPRKAHLFYMPFSSRMLEYSVYVPHSHDRTTLAAYLRNYTNVLASKYPFWNRTNGADHFFVACHDWAPYETRHHMEQCIKTMCNADVTQGFKIGKDVSFPETYVRSARNTIRDIGGEPPSNRPTLAFFAGSMHGYLRPILLSHWLNKDPDMKIFGRMPFGVASRMNYIQHMKTSKYCICAKGFEVNSPRVVEAIFYECVPVIISDNFVPPFFEVLNWDTFSVTVAEKDIPNLKNILLSIPYERYVAMQTAVKKVQRHFIWHDKPEKYDLFSMTLHSIWYSRVFSLKGK